MRSAGGIAPEPWNAPLNCVPISPPSPLPPSIGVADDVGTVGRGSDCVPSGDTIGSSVSGSMRSMPCDSEP